ncbi:MOR1B protein, partial [Rhinopomastus cyanomelas]|nr:MOR1B protein [Rhinopomastus cyanomelas]
VGNSCVLLCPPEPNKTMVAWKISLSAGTNCSFSYRADRKTSKSNCSDNISWKSRPHLDPTIEIQQVGLADEGNYTCEVATADGNFYTRYHLTVLVPPRLLLHCDDRGNPVCEAVAGKPAAQISWVPESNSTKEEIHGKGTVTVLSKVRACSSHLTNVTCVVLHPAGNQSKTIAC